MSVGLFVVGFDAIGLVGNGAQNVNVRVRRIKSHNNHVAFVGNQAATVRGIGESHEYRMQNDKVRNAALIDIAKFVFPILAGLPDNIIRNIVVG